MSPERAGHNEGKLAVAVALRDAIRHQGLPSPGDDDQLLLAGKQACRLLYTGQPASAVIASTAAQYGAGPDQAATLVNAARGTYCTQAPG